MNVKSRVLPGLLLATAAIAAAVLAPVPVAGQAGKDAAFDQRVADAAQGRIAPTLL